MGRMGENGLEGVTGVERLLVNIPVDILSDILRWKQVPVTLESLLPKDNESSTLIDNPSLLGRDDFESLLFD